MVVDRGRGVPVAAGWPCVFVLCVCVSCTRDCGVGVCVLSVPVTILGVKCTLLEYDADRTGGSFVLSAILMPFVSVSVFFGSCTGSFCMISAGKDSK